MPGILHETAVQKALQLLGPDAATKGMRPQLRKWLNRSSLLSGDIRQTLCTDELPCVELAEKDGLTCKRCIERMNREDVASMPTVLPDAFRIHRDDPRCSHDEKLFVVDAIEIDGSHTLRHKVDRWLAFGDAVDFSDYAFLRLRIFNEHFVQIGEYTEADLFRMVIEDIVRDAKHSNKRADPGWAKVMRGMREGGAPSNG